MQKLLVLLLGMILFILLGYWCIYLKVAPSIQKDISVRTQSALQSAGFQSLVVDVKGRDVLVKGMVADKDMRRVVDQALSIKGVRLINNQVTVNHSLAENYHLYAENDGKHITMKGFVPDSITHHNMIAYVMEIFGNDSITDQLVERDNPPHNWTVMSKAGLDALQKLKMGTLQVSNKELELSGIASSPLIKEQVAQLLSKKIPQNYITNTSVSIEIIPEEPQPVDKSINQLISEEPIQVRIAKCQQQLDNILSRSRISFKTGGSELLPANNALLDEIHQVITGTPNCQNHQILIKGHTDSQGRAIFNQNLSEKRAIAIRHYLIKQGIDKNPIIAQGLGESEPIADNKTTEGRKMNRRIEIIIVDGTVTLETEGIQQ